MDCHPDTKSPFWEAVLEAWRRGHADFDAAAARACLDSIALSGPCRVPSWVPDELACFEMLVGNVPEGGACSLGTIGIWSPECQESLVCVTEGACPGVCTRPSVAGEPCSRARSCARDHYCEDGACVRRALLGEACGPVACDVDLQCIDGVCSSGPALSDPCGPGFECRGTQHCVPDATGTNRCMEWYGAEGDQCRQLDQCAFPFICWGPPDRRCTRGVALGAACDDSTTPCAPGGRCVTGQCREIVLPEGQCDEDRVCPLSHRCVDSECVPLPSTGDLQPQAGEACAEYLFYCATGLYCREIDSSFVCSPPCA